MEHTPVILQTFKLNYRDDHSVSFEAEKIQLHNHVEYSPESEWK